ncbi:MAG TPA: single-stranded DNA-binding protein [Candidatus Onthousia faecigallinarum]|nr:single-stranded DNA-binding protein [Candidatus Onthousia faecigallinarum]
MNKVFLIGRLTRDPELRYTGNNTAVATFTLAVNRNFTNQSGEREADFINCVVWRKQAENVKKYVHQGTQVAVEGRIQVRSYDDQNGQRRYVTEVVADNVEFLTPKGASNNNNSTSTNNFSAPTQEPTPYDFPSDSGSTNNQSGTDVSSNPYADFGASIEISDDDLPF